MLFWNRNQSLHIDKMPWVVMYMYTYDRVGNFGQLSYVVSTTTGSVFVYNHLSTHIFIVKIQLSA